MFKTFFITAALVGSAAALCAQTYPDTFKVSYFSNDPVLVHITSQGADLGPVPGPGLSPQASPAVTPPGNSCAMIYVFDPNQELSECCGCKLTPNGLRTLDGANLLSNPLTGVALSTGSIEIISSTGYPTCNPSKPVPSPALTAWATHTQATATTETPLLDSNLSTAELNLLAKKCGAIQSNGSGFGKCTCGTGD
jgi:hypothetical protein